MKRIIFAASLCCAVTPALAQEPAAAPRVYELAEVETQPVPANLEELRAALESAYPADRRATGQGARVSVAFVLNTDGVPGAVRVTESSDAAFDSATVAAMALLRFTPATVAGNPVAVRVEVPVEWEPPADEPAPAAGVDARRAPLQSADGVRIYRLSEVDEQPRPTNLNTLRRELERLYPPALRNAGAEGVVQVNFVVTEHGRVDDVLVTHTTDLRFNLVTVEAIGTLRFRPGRVNGRAVRTQVELPINWNVDPPERTSEPVGRQDRGDPRRD